MDTKSKNKIREVVVANFNEIFKRSEEARKNINDKLSDTLDFFQTLISQIPQSTSCPLITKTPKVIKKKAVQRIETIPEDDIVTIDTTNSTVIEDKISNNLNETTSRTRRKASRKAEDNIRVQQSMSQRAKLRRPSDFEESIAPKRQTGSRSKRKKSGDSSDDESTQAPAKLSKTEESTIGKNISKEINKNSQKHHDAAKTPTEEEKNNSRASRSSSRRKNILENDSAKKHDIINETVIAPRGNNVAEQSMYEDAIEKPIMNSTMNVNSTYSLQNVSVVLERLSAAKLNETVTLNSSTKKNIQQKTFDQKAESKSKPTKRSSLALSDRMKELRKAMVNKEFDELLTDDESSPEVKKPKTNVKRRPKQVANVSSSEDEVLPTPIKSNLKDKNIVTAFKEPKGTYKSNALFSPYAKESVKKRVEAFEQVGSSNSTDIEQSTRITRTKTRARAAEQARAVENSEITEKIITQNLARKSLAKAKKISIAKLQREAEELKENKLQSAQKENKIAIMEKATSNKCKDRATPLNKKTQLPLFVNRIPHTPMNQSNMNTTKTLSATRVNIITTMDSFIQAPKSVSKRNSLEKQEEKKRKFNDEDARKKRDDALRLQMEEKKRKRQEKELKNKLAREAKEKQEFEKRQKAEKEREEKARLAQQMQEKQRIEMEKKRQVQLQRAQEREERRKLEEQNRLQLLQEQEDAERLLAEQKRREQEAERRKEAEARAQQQATTEAMKAKHQMAAQSKCGPKYNGPTTYVLDSEPDEDDSDDETCPKHVIPYWALPQVRKTQLKWQQYIPEGAVYKFFDTKKCTPDLTQLFQGIDRSRLKRTSSAIWKSPPRYSMMEAE